MGLPVARVGVVLWGGMHLYSIIAVAETKEDAVATMSGGRSGAFPSGAILGLYQDSIWVGFAGSAGPGGSPSVDFGAGGFLAEIAEVVFDGGVGGNTVWRVTILDASTLVRRHGFPLGYIFWVVSYIAFGHRISEGVFVLESQDYRNPSG